MKQSAENSKKSPFGVEKGQPIFSFSPVVLPVPGRPADLQMKVSAPVKGNDLPVIIISHGHGQSNFLASLHGYGPLADFFAGQGFVVIQPTHLNSRTLTLDSKSPDAPLYWRSRPKDIQFIIDNLSLIISTVPGLEGRVDLANISAIGHSLGGHTLAMLSGMEVTDPATGEKVSNPELRLKARVMIGVPGSPAGLSEKGRQLYSNPLAGTDYSTMTLPALVVNGDKDKNVAFSDLDNWRADAYHHSSGPKDMLTVFGAEHIFGGISGYDAKETSDESPALVKFVCEAILAYVRSAIDANDSSWEDAKKELNGVEGAKGRIDTK